jgi:hypothetical protein
MDARRFCRVSAWTIPLGPLTLVLTLATPEYVVQVSDRRGVRVSNSGEVTWCDDEHNKAVSWKGRHCCAYAGLADLGEDRRTDLWLAKQLNELEPQVNEQRNMTWLWQAVAERCTREFQSDRNRRLCAEARGHSFVTTGWGTLDGGEELCSYILVVTNQLDSAGRPLTVPASEFCVVPKFLEGSDCSLVHAGYRMGDQEEASFVQRLAAVVATYAGPDAAMATLCEKIREVASEQPTVGTGLMISVIPRASIAADTESVVSAPQLGLIIARARGDTPQERFDRIQTVMRVGAPAFWYLPTDTSDAALF